MEKPSILFTGILGAFIVSCGTMVLMPHGDIGGLLPQVAWDENQPSPSDQYPVKLTGGDGHLPGQVAYTSNGCFYCHSQQVRDPQYGPDMERGWGIRRTVARDYIFENTPLLGSMRMGPDLANYGSQTWRNEPAEDPKKPTKRDKKWILTHLYQPQTIDNNSKCPPFRYLFETVELGAQPAANAVAIEGNKQVIPTPDAEHIAEYLLRLDRSHELKEAKIVIKPKEAAKK